MWEQEHFGGLVYKLFVEEICCKLLQLDDVKHLAFLASIT